MKEPINNLFIKMAISLSMGEHLSPPTNKRLHRAIQNWTRKEAIIELARLGSNEDLTGKEIELVLTCWDLASVPYDRA